MRKIVELLDSEQRFVLLWLTDFGIAVFSSGLTVVVLKDIVSWLTS